MRRYTTLLLTAFLLLAIVIAGSAYLAGSGHIDRRTRVQELVDEVKAMGAQKMILGCTELPIAFERVGITEDTVDPTTVLAQRAIQKVGAKVKKEYLIA